MEEHEEHSVPVAGIDCPRNFEEFNRWFTDEAACRSYIFRLRWPKGYQCQRCGSERSPWVTSRGYLHCQECQREISITAGTVFERTRMPLRTWFLAMWLVTGQKQGASALGLQRVLGLGSYQTAWTWLHKLRRAMVRPGRERLRGRVEVDETYTCQALAWCRSFVMLSNRVPRFSRMGGVATTIYPSTAMNTTRPSCLRQGTRRMWRCQVYTELHRC